MDNKYITNTQLEKKAKNIIGPIFFNGKGDTFENIF